MAMVKECQSLNVGYCLKTGEKCNRKPESELTPCKGAPKQNDKPKEKKT